MAHVPADNVFGLPEFDFDTFNAPGVIFQRNGNDISTPDSVNGEVKIATFIYNSQMYFVFATKETQPIIRVVGTGYSANWNIAINTFTYDNQLVRCNSQNPGASTITTTSYTVNTWTQSPTSSDTRNKIAWLMIYGGYSGYSVTYDLVNCVGDTSNPVVIPPNAIITPAHFTPDETTDETYTFNSGSCWIDGTGFDGAPILYVWEPETGNLKIGIVTSDITVHVHAYGDPYQDIDGESELPGGGSVGVPGLPGLTATSSGVIGLFSPTPSQMKLLSDFMWTDFGGTGSTEVDVLKEIVQALKRLVSNPLDYVVGLNIIPSQGLSVGSAQEIRFGFVNSGVSMPRLTNQYFIVDCGSLNFDTVCGDTFLDYAPYSKFSIYLPYIGVKDVDANDFVGHTISVLYHGDVVTGGVTAYILKDGSVMYQYSGCCALNVPLSADSWGTTISGAVQIATSIVAGAVSGGGAGATMAMAKGASSVASNPSMLSPQVAHSGAVSGSAGCMGVQYPFVIREAVRFHSTVGMNTVSGYPSYYYKKLSTVHGYTEVLDVHLSNIPATDGEIAEIENLLKGGVVL